MASVTTMPDLNFVEPLHGKNLGNARIHMKEYQLFRFWDGEDYAYALRSNGTNYSLTRTFGHGINGRWLKDGVPLSYDDSKKLTDLDMGAEDDFKWPELQDLNGKLIEPSTYKFENSGKISRAYFEHGRIRALKVRAVAPKASSTSPS